MALRKQSRFGTADSGVVLHPFLSRLAEPTQIHVATGSDGDHSPLSPESREDPQSRSLNGGSYKVPLVV